MVFIFALFYSDFFFKIAPHKIKRFANRVRMKKKNNIKTNAILLVAFVQKNKHFWHHILTRIK